MHFSPETQFITQLALICNSQTECNKLAMILFYTSNGLHLYAALDSEQKWKNIPEALKTPGRQPNGNWSQMTSRHDEACLHFLFYFTGMDECSSTIWQKSTT